MMYEDIRERCREHSRIRTREDAEAAVASITPAERKVADALYPREPFVEKPWHRVCYPPIRRWDPIRKEWKFDYSNSTEAKGSNRMYASYPSKKSRSKSVPII